MMTDNITIPLADYKRLLEAAESDDMIVRCETCGAWLDLDDPATAFLDDYTGCWKTAIEGGDPATCRSYRVVD